MNLDDLNDLALKRSIEAGPDAVRALIEAHADARALAATADLRERLARAERGQAAAVEAQMADRALNRKLRVDLERAEARADRLAAALVEFAGGRANLPAHLRAILAAGGPPEPDLRMEVPDRSRVPNARPAPAACTCGGGRYAPTDEDHAPDCPARGKP